MKDVWHVGCLFSAILAKEPVFDLKDIFLDPTGPPGPFLGGGGVLKGSRGSKLKLKDIWHVGCLFSAIMAKELIFDFKEIFLDQTGPLGPFLGGL